MLSYSFPFIGHWRPCNRRADSYLSRIFQNFVTWLFSESCVTPDLCLRCLPKHLPWSEQHLVTSVLVVLDEKRPLLLHLLSDVQDGGDDVAPRLIQVSDKGRSINYNVRLQCFGWITCWGISWFRTLTLVEAAPRSIPANQQNSRCLRWSKAKVKQRRSKAKHLCYRSKCLEDLLLHWVLQLLQCICHDAIQIQLTMMRKRGTFTNQLSLSSFSKIAWRGIYTWTFDQALVTRFIWWWPGCSLFQGQQAPRWCFLPPMPENKNCQRYLPTFSHLISRL